MAKRKGLTQAQMKAKIAEKLGIPKSSVDLVLKELGSTVEAELRRTGSATVPGIVKLTKKRKKATKRRRGTNPFTGEEMMFKAKPAKNVVRARPLKSVKDSV